MRALGVVMLVLSGCGATGSGMCAMTTCSNGGTVVTPACTCDCSSAVGFEGPRCETQTRAKLLGNHSTSVSWTSSDGSSGSYAAHGTTFATSSSFVDRVQITLGGDTMFGGNLTRYGCGMNSGNEFAFYARVTADSRLEIPSQLADAYITVVGQGTVQSSASAVTSTLTFRGSSMQQLGNCTTDYTVTLNKL